MEGKPHSCSLTCLNHFYFYADVDGVENHNIDLKNKTAAPSSTGEEKKKKNLEIK